MTSTDPVPRRRVQSENIKVQIEAISSVLQVLNSGDNQSVQQSPCSQNPMLDFLEENELEKPQEVKKQSSSTF